MIDTVIVGLGPAGLSAAINARARNRSVLVLGRDRYTSAIYKAEKINNHLGMPDVTGKEMIDTLYEHAKAEGVEFKTGRVMQVTPLGDYFGINFQNEFIEAKTVILTIGVSKGVNKADREEELLGKGVSYCATCDGMLYRDADVVVVGETPEGEEDANFLSEICNTVHYISGYEEVKNLNPNIKVIKGKVDKVLGDDRVTAVEVEGSKIECTGAFFIKASIEIESIVSEILVDEKKAIKVDRNMQTNIKGLFAAGDCTGWPLQISKAIGEGLIAAQAADKYIRGL